MNAIHNLATETVRALFDLGREHVHVLAIGAVLAPFAWIILETLARFA